MLNSKMFNKVTKNPKNYAAIYARISGTRDNNSISAQVQLANDALDKKNLLVYDVYTDHVSGKTTSPHKRKGFGKLLLDAKAGCFKTLIIYRLDRLVRNYKDWIEIKTTLTKLGIELIYSDESQSFPLNSSQGEFFQNLTVMIAEMEPDTISLRASNGRIFRREQGAYSCGKNIPFGYLRESRNELDSEKISKSLFIQEPIKLAFIKYMFLEFNSLILEEKLCSTNNTKASIPNVYSSLENAINYIEAHSDFDKIPIPSNLNNTSLCSLYEEINEFIKSKGSKYVFDEIKLVKSHYVINDNTDKKKNMTNIVTCLKNNTYAGYMLKDSKHLCKGLIYLKDSKGNTIKDNGNNPIYEELLDESSFIKTSNLEGIVPYDTFKNVYAYLIYEELGKIDRTPNFLLKGKLKCSCNKKLKLIDSNYLHCGDSNCSGFIKNDLLKFIVGQIVKDCLSEDTTIIKVFLNKLNRKIEINTQNIRYHKQNKFDAVANYLNSQDESFIDLIHTKNNSISSYTQLCSQYRSKISNINTLLDEVSALSNSNSNKINSDLSNSINNISNYILTSEDLFISIFAEIIKEIKVKLNNESSKTKGTLNIKYEFTPEKTRNIY